MPGKHHFDIECECEQCLDIQLEPYPTLDETIIRERVEKRCECDNCVEDRPWVKFRRTKNTEFYAILNPQNEWVDSATTYAQALEWAMMDAGDDFKSPYEWYNTQNREIGYNIVHHSLVKKMFFAGLIK
jgi:hypothetical protein